MTNKKQDASAKNAPTPPAQKPIPPDVQKIIDDKLGLNDSDKQNKSKVDTAFQKAIADKQDKLKDKQLPQAQQQNLQNDLAELQDAHNKYKKATAPDVDTAQQKEKTPEKKKGKAEAVRDALADGFTVVKEDSMSSIFKSGLGIGQSLKKMFASKPDDKKTNEESEVVLSKSSDTKVAPTPREEEVPGVPERGEHNEQEHEQDLEQNERQDEGQRRRLE